MRRIMIGLMLTLTIGGYGCRTTAIGSPMVTSVPANLTREEIEIAIAAMLAAPTKERNPANTYTIVLANPLGAMLWDEYRRQPPLALGWFVESWEPGLIYAGHQERNHYLRVAIRISDAQVETAISESRNLQQSDGHIHRKAKEWVELLDTKIREAIGRAALAKRGLDVRR